MFLCLNHHTVSLQICGDHFVILKGSRDVFLLSRENDTVWALIKNGLSLVPIVQVGIVQGDRPVVIFLVVIEPLDMALVHSISCVLSKVIASDSQLSIMHFAMVVLVVCYKDTEDLIRLSFK